MICQPSLTQSQKQRNKPLIGRQFFSFVFLLNNKELRQSVWFKKLDPNPIPLSINFKLFIPKNDEGKIDRHIHTCRGIVDQETIPQKELNEAIQASFKFGRYEIDAAL